MKGVKINNYIDNRIVLSSRKLKNQVQTLIQSNRPRPLVIRHLNYYEEEEEIAINSQEKETLKAIEGKSNKKAKKKSKPVSVNNHEVHQQLNQKVEKREKVKKQSGKKTSPAKKRSSQSSPSGNSQSNFNSTHKKLRSTSKNAQGLGKRSKSTIIKRHKSPSNIVVEQEKKKIDQNLRINLNPKKEPEVPKKKKSKKEKKTGPDTKGKELKKNLSSLNISEKRIRNDKQQGTKTSRQPSKSVISSATLSKPVSARENKKKQTNIVKNLFGSVDKKFQSEHITFQELLAIQNKDFKIKSAIMKLEDAINSKGSRKKLSEKLELLAQKLKQINSENQKSEEEESEEEDILENTHRRELSKHEESVQEFFPQIDSTQKKEEAKNEFTNPKIVTNLLKQQKIEPQNEKQPSEDSVQQYILVQDVKKQPQIPKQLSEKRQNYLKDSDNRRIELQRQNGLYIRQEQEQDNGNPLIGRKTGGDPYLDLVDYDSINSIKSNQDQKRLQINQLKKFQEESDLMMKRIKQLESKKKSEEPGPGKAVEESPPQSTRVQLQPRPQPQPAPQPQSPKSLQLKNYTLQKYPVLNPLRSPKFNPQEILQLLKLKQRVQTDKHEKLSELVTALFDKKMVSPKTYSIQVQFLREQERESKEVLDGYKRHAEELANLLSEIKREKEEISSIDELIRGEKWGEAMNVIKENDKSAKKGEKEEEREKVGLSDFQKQRLEDQNSEAVYYSGEDSQVSQTGIKLIQIQNDQQQKQPSKTQPSSSSPPAQNLIKIDESNLKVPKKQKGFDSNLFFIKQYCIALCEYVRDHHKESFRKRIGEPMSYDLKRLLRSFRVNRDGSLPAAVNSLFEDLAYHDEEFHYNKEPISLEVFEEFNKQYPTIKYYHKEQSQDATLQGIFLKSIYDALNESIMIEKPGSVNGRALPWAHSSKHLKNLKNSLQSPANELQKSQQSQDLIFGISIARIIQWGSCLCGFIPDTVELQNTEIDQEYINHIRETRTALLLQKMLAEEEATMYRTELEETQVKLCLAQLVAEELMREMAQEMRKVVLRAMLRGVDY